MRLLCIGVDANIVIVFSVNRPLDLNEKVCLLSEVKTIDHKISTKQKPNKFLKIQHDDAEKLRYVSKMRSHFWCEKGGKKERERASKVEGTCALVCDGFSWFVH